MSTKQARKTARRKARQAKAYEAFKRLQKDPEVIRLLEGRKFDYLTEPSKQLIVEKFG